MGVAIVLARLVSHTREAVVPGLDPAAALAVDRALGQLLETAAALDREALDGPGTYLLAVVENVQDNLSVDGMHMNVYEGLHARHLDYSGAVALGADVEDIASAVFGPAAADGRILADPKQLGVRHDTCDVGDVDLVLGQCARPLVEILTGQLFNAWRRLRPAVVEATVGSRRQCGGRSRSGLNGRRPSSAGRPAASQDSSRGLEAVGVLRRADRRPDDGISRTRRRRSHADIVGDADGPAAATVADSGRRIACTPRPAVGRVAGRGQSRQRRDRAGAAGYTHRASAAAVAHRRGRVRGARRSAR